MGSFGCSVPTLRCGMWDPVPGPGIEQGPPALEAWSLSHWTTREVPENVQNVLISLLFLKDIFIGYRIISLKTLSLSTLKVLLLCFLAYITAEKKSATKILMSITLHVINLLTLTAYFHLL